jgi:hypothetical protein
VSFGQILRSHSADENSFIIACRVVVQADAFFVSWPFSEHTIKTKGPSNPSLPEYWNQANQIQFFSQVTSADWLPVRDSFVCL